MDIPDTKPSTIETPGIPQEKQQLQAPYLKQPSDMAQEKAVNKKELASITKKDVEEILDTFHELSDVLKTRLNFSVHEENNEIVVKVIDKQTDTVIRQFPSEEMLQLQDKMRDLSGFLLNENV